ncbi:MAG: heavy metal translocating P-type ATPase [Beijerinckiaceae bacterium]
MQLTIRHFLPGRVRLHIPLLYHESHLVDSAIVWLQKQPGIENVRVNSACASLVVEYDRRRPEIWAQMSFFLQNATIDQLRLLATQTHHQAKHTPKHLELPKPREIAAKSGTALTATSRRWPLVWPTVSIALCFSLHPVALAVNIPLLLWNSLPIAKRAFRVIRREKRLNVDFLDVLAIGASVAHNNILAGAIVAWLIHLGDWIRDLTAAGSRRAVSELLEYQAKTAWVLRDGEVVAVPAAEVAMADLVVVHTGEMIPVDGEVVEGHATIDQKTITGEGLPVNRGIGEVVFAATVLREGQIVVRAMRVGHETTAAQIVKLVEAAPIGETRMQNHAERLADRLVMPTLAIATGTAALTADFNRFLSLVIIDYGTGIRVAAPTSVLSSMTHAARAGIIIKSGAHMERLARVDTVVFDKTGTLSNGMPGVIDVICYQEKYFSAPDLLGLVASAETRVKHPVAEAVRAKAEELGSVVPLCDSQQFHVGLGVEARVNGNYVHVGSERFLRQSGIKVDRAAADRASFDERGCSSLYIAVDGVLAGMVPYADQIRPESKAVVSTLHRMGIRNTIMLTGDNAVVAKAVGDRLGLTRQFAGTLPADKADIIQELQRQGHCVAMVGDGINDSPALSYADIGIAMKHGAEVTLESANVLLMEDSLWKLVKAIEISRGAVGLIRQNYAIVSVLNTVALALALPGGLITPEMTALISNGSAILASLNGLRPILRYQ